MKPEPLEKLARATRTLAIQLEGSLFHGDSVWLIQSAAEAEEELTAMLTPIGEEALTAAGWKGRQVSAHCVRYAYHPDQWLTLEWNEDEKRWEFALGRLGRTIIASPENMYDLRELVRLLEFKKVVQGAGDEK